jgi:uncharacterized membrane protein YdbT with pleckstrin-like domain
MVSRLRGERRLALVDAQTKEQPEQPAPARSQEETVYKLKPSIWRSQPFTFLLYILLILSPAITAAVAYRYGLDARTLALVSVLPCAFGCLMLIVWKLRCKSTELTITTRRCILRHGILGRYTTEIRHSDIRNIQVAQSFWQRICGVGHICISSEMEDEHDLEVSGIPHPDRVAETIRKLQA